MSSQCFFSLLVLSVFLSVASVGNSVHAEQQISGIQQEWDQTYFTLDNKPRKKALRKLIEKTEAMRKQQPQNAGLYIWEAIIRASYNEAAGGLGGLRQARAAKSLLETSIELDPNALDGLAYTELGALYYRVPGWPVSFGDNDKAKELLLKGLSFEKTDLEAFYLLGHFYIDEENWPAAIDTLEKGLRLPEQPDRPAFEQIRRNEMQLLLNEAKEQLAN